VVSFVVTSATLLPLLPLLQLYCHCCHYCNPAATTATTATLLPLLPLLHSPPTPSLPFYNLAPPLSHPSCPALQSSYPDGTVCVMLPLIVVVTIYWEERLPQDTKYSQCLLPFVYCYALLTAFISLLLVRQDVVTWESTSAHGICGVDQLLLTHL
jgi:hypothetical protein